MRKERNERAKITTTAKKEQQPTLSSTFRTVGGVSNLVSLDESDTIDDEMELITPGGVSQGKSKIKKKKKGKR
jgi:hypothetical protein